MSSFIYNYEKDNSKTLPELNLLFISKTKYDNDWPSHPHTHRFTEIMFIISGTGFLLLQEDNLVKHPIKRGCMLIIKPNTLHTETSSEKEPISYYALGFEGLIEDISSDNFVRGLSQIEGKPSNSLILDLSQDFEDYEFYFKNLYSYMENKYKFYKEFTKNFFDNFIIKLYNKNNLSTVKATKTPYPAILEKVIDYININYCSDIHLDDLSAQVFLSNTHLIRLFRQSFSMTPYEYIINKRIEAAKYLMCYTSYSVSEISDIIGFSSTSNFIKKFKASNGMTPNKYIKERKK